MTYSPSKFPWVPVPNCVCPNLDNECLRPAPYTRPILCVNKVIKNITYFLSSGGELEQGGGSSPSAGGCSPPLAIALYDCSMFLILILFYVAFVVLAGAPTSTLLPTMSTTGPCVWPALLRIEWLFGLPRAVARLRPPDVSDGRKGREKNERIMKINN